ncbi:MAG: hypothetical protein SWX82_06350, partial [Cyanobacteriota bacterium]|nr:hypothetical protein [Cyanobacteriota bacterium]
NFDCRIKKNIANFPNILLYIFIDVWEMVGFCCLFSLVELKNLSFPLNFFWLKVELSQNLNGYELLIFSRLLSEDN